jgi:Protein of unknown function (DUF2599)
VRVPFGATAAIAAVAVAVLIAAGGCARSDATPEPSASHAATSSATTPPSAEPLVVSVSSGAVEVTVEVPGATIDDPHVQVSPADDGQTVTLDLAGRASSAPVVLRLETPGTFADNPDGSVTVLDDAGAAVGGFTAPTGGTSLVLAEPTRAELQPPEDAASGEVALTLGTHGLASATWGEREGGRSLAVVPTAWAREAGQAGRTVLWDELVESVPGADTPVMHDQLVCHALGAPDKAEWNLEPWRPDVGLVDVLAAGCNPR